MTKHLLKLWLDSAKATGSAPLTNANNYVWSNIAWDLDKILPPHVLNALAEAKSYKFWLESIAWRNRDELTTTPFLIKLDVGADNVFDIATGLNANALTMLKDNYELRTNSNEAPLETKNKSWLYSRSLKVIFTKNDGTEFAENEFHTGVPAQTSYLLSLVIEYDA